MIRERFSRRDFSRLTAAAFGGVVAGGAVSASGQEAEKKKDYGIDPALLLAEPHVCRGLNSCKGQGGCKSAGNECKGHNACAGAGGAATASAHSCKGMNDCKGQSGCGGYPGQNATCKGQGECAVPLTADTWKIARKQFEQIAKAAGVKVNPVPKEA